MADIGNDIERAKQLLEAGELVSIPTETVYGLAGNALNATAVTNIFKVKDRPSFDPLIVHVASAEDVSKYVTDIPVAANKLIDRFWPGPLTLLLKKKGIIPDIVTSGLDTVGVRCPAHPLTLGLLKKPSFPLAAPSANPFGYVSPTTALHVDEQLGKKLPYILDGGPCRVGIESTIVGFEGKMPVIYRMGGLRVEDIEATIGEVSVQTQSTSNPKAPGQLQSHYAPTKKVIIGDVTSLIKQHDPRTTGVLTFSDDHRMPHQIILSPVRDMEAAAQNLFVALRQFDKMPVDRIIAEFVPNTGLGRAINDRLTRAAAL